MTHVVRPTVKITKWPLCTHLWLFLLYPCCPSFRLITIGQSPSLTSELVYDLNHHRGWAATELGSGLTSYIEWGVKIQSRLFWQVGDDFGAPPIHREGETLVQCKQLHDVKVSIIDRLHAAREKQLSRSSHLSLLKRLKYKLQWALLSKGHS